ncbi:chaplin [Streptomyces vilmorinianum]|uniref:chaplin n=1 Tax=Streptomyces vilmorinianum TaxID=3051092 RepID=UPI0010FAF356|nr:chaplin [Streptomyces vilmorinianum]
MRQIRRSGLATLMVTGGALALSAGAAHADSGAQGAAVDSPGVISGNAVQLPVHVPVNVCGNTVNVVGLLNPAAGNSCANTTEPDGYGSDADGGGGSHRDEPGTPHTGGQNGGGNASNGGGSTAEGVAKNSPGVLSGNGIQLPIDLPVNVSGNSVNVVGIGNPAFGNTAVNGPGHPEAPAEQPKPQGPGTLPPAPGDDKTPGAPVAPAPGTQTSSVALASTGSDLVGFAAPAGAALLLGGALVYRRARRMGAEG